MNKISKFIITFLIAFFLTSALLYVFKRKNKGLGTVPKDYFTKQKIKITNQKGNENNITVNYSAWFMPYNESGQKTNFYKVTKAKSGVYFIRSKKTKETYYIGYSSSNLYKALYRHFQYHNENNAYYSGDGTQKRIYYADRFKYEIMLGLTSKQNAPKLERHLILEQQPRDCTIKYDYYIEKMNETADSDFEINTDDLDFWDTIPEQDIETPF